MVWPSHRGAFTSLPFFLRVADPVCASRLLALEVSAATAGVVRQDLKLVATARRCTTLFNRANGPAGELSNLVMNALVQRMEALKDSGMLGPPASAVVGHAPSVRDEAVEGESGLTLELFDLRADPLERTNLLGTEAATTGRNKRVVDELKAMLHTAALRASIALNASRADGRRRFEPSLRYWFCFQPFKASAPDWPLVERYHTCHNRSAFERSGALFRD